MFEGLTENLSKALRNLRGIGKLTEENMSEALTEVRKALLSADVHFKVAREFTERVKNECIGREVINSITPGQQIIKIISDELEKLLGEGSTELSPIRPLKIMMVGLHGSGKTTTSAKLAGLLKKRGYTPALIACDIYRPAAIDQLEALGKQIGAKVYADRNSKNVPDLASRLEKQAIEEGANAIIFDTAGRLQIDQELIDEIIKLKEVEKPQEVLLVADSALGQEAVNVAKAFNEAVNITGVVLTKLDGDARGGAALSIKTVSGAPIKFAGTGEKLENIEIFHADRMAQRILGMGDVVSLVEKAQETMDLKEAEKMAEKLRKAEFDLEDFLSQMRQIKKLGSLGGILKMLPGMSGISVGEREEKKMRQTEAIILSMTPQERRNPNIINARRRLRIASGSGTQVRDVNALLKQFEGMRKMMKMMRGDKGRRRMAGMMDAMRKHGKL
ncbi:MAG: signal recognition particle protein [Opitutales bacterium]|nr:signal recognition particle protein [Opitutales bacterium]